MITQKLFHESLNCPIAFIELVRQFGELSTENRTEWLDSLSGVQAATLTFASMMHSENPAMLLAAMFGELDVDTAQEMQEALLDRVNIVYGLSMVEGDPIPENILNDAKQYALENGIA